MKTMDEFHDLLWITSNNVTMTMRLRMINEIEKENENGNDTTDDDDGSMNNSNNNHDESLHNRGVENPPICAKSASP